MFSYTLTLRTYAQNTFNPNLSFAAVFALVVALAVVDDHFGQVVDHPFRVLSRDEEGATAPWFSLGAGREFVVLIMYVLRD